MTMAHQHNHNEHDHQEGSCCSHVGPSSVQQSMGEMEFERGIWSAAYDGEDDRVQKFLSQGVNADSRDSSGLTALHYAARNGHLAVCRSLLRRGATVDLRTRSGGSTALQRAAYRGEREVVNFLIDSGGDVLLQDSDGQTALHKSAEGAKRDVAVILLSKNKDLVNIKDNRGRLPKDCLPPMNKDLVGIFSPT